MRVRLRASVFDSRGLVERDAVQRDAAVGDLHRVGFAGVHPRLAVLRVPVASPVDQLAGAVADDPVARIAQQPLVLGRLHVDVGAGVDQLDHRTHLVRPTARLELTALDEEVEEVRMRLQPAVLDPPHERSRALRGASTDRSAMHAPSMAAFPTCTTCVIGQVRDEADSPRRLLLQVPAEAAGEVEHVDVVERDAVVAEDNVQAGDVGALGLRQLVDVAFEEVHVVRRGRA